MARRIETNRWEASATVAVDTNWFASNVDGPTGIPVKHTLMIMVPTSTVVEVDITDGTTLKTATLNAGVALAANAWYIFDIIVYIGFTYNIQHKTTTQNVACFIMESDNVDI